MTWLWAGFRGIEKVRNIFRRSSHRHASSSSTVVFGPEPFCGISLSTVRTDKQDWVYSEFIYHWTAAPKMNHAKQLIVRPEIKRAGTLLKFSTAGSN